jgi:hypothetical protein
MGIILCFRDRLARLTSFTIRERGTDVFEKVCYINVEFFQGEMINQVYIMEDSKLASLVMIMIMTKVMLIFLYTNAGIRKYYIPKTFTQHITVLL